MSLQIIDTDDGRALWLDTTTDWVFGPMFESVEHADAFERFVNERFGVEPRRVTYLRLRAAYDDFRRLPLVECRRCLEPLAAADTEHLCPGCRECDHCGNDDVPTDCGPDGWLCKSCRDGHAEAWEITQDGARLIGG